MTPKSGVCADVWWATERGRLGTCAFYFPCLLNVRSIFSVFLWGLILKLYLCIKYLKLAVREQSVSLSICLLLSVRTSGSLSCVSQAVQMWATWQLLTQWIASKSQQESDIMGLLHVCDPVCVLKHPNFVADGTCWGFFFFSLHVTTCCVALKSTTKRP